MAILGALMVGCVQPASLPASSKAVSWGYASWWQPIQEAGIRTSSFDRLIYFDVTLASDGTVADAHGWPAQQMQLRSSATSLGIPLDVTLALHGRESLVSLFSSAEAVDRLLQTALSVADDPMVAGLHLDLEVYDPLPDATLQELRAFVPRLKQALRSMHPQRTLSVFVPLSQTPLYDKASLDGVDWVVMQAYDAHWLTSPSAGPVAPLDGPESITWTRAANHARALGIPKAQTLMSYPLYGYEWPAQLQDARAATSGPGVALTLEAVPQAADAPVSDSVRSRVNMHGCRRDQASGSAYYQFVGPDQRWVTGWYEGEWSLHRKSAFIDKHELAGIAFFSVGGDGYHLTRIFNKLRRQANQQVPPELGQC